MQRLKQLMGYLCNMRLDCRDRRCLHASLHQHFESCDDERCYSYNFATECKPIYA